jgi:hypothetical protein
MRRIMILSLLICASAGLVLTTAAPARAFDLAETARQFAQKGEKPHPGGPRPPGPNTGPSAGPIGGPGRPPAPDVAPQQEALITELVVLLVGHAANDLQHGAELFAADPSEKNLNFLRYTANKVVTTLELDPQDGTLAPVLAALQRGDSASIRRSTADLGAELRQGLGTDLGPEYLWYFEAGQNISAVEFAIWEESGFNLLHFYGKSVQLQLNFATPAAASAGDFATLIAALQAHSGQSADLVALMQDYIALRGGIEQRYGFPGSGMVLW